MPETRETPETRDSIHNSGLPRDTRNPTKPGRNPKPRTTRNLAIFGHKPFLLMADALARHPLRARLGTGTSPHSERSERIGSASAARRAGR
jgi:hypothetical protein